MIKFLDLQKINTQYAAELKQAAVKGAIHLHSFKYYKNLNMNNNKMLFITLFLTFIYEFVLSLQGFDLCDEGWVLSSFQQIFNSPSSVEYQFLYYLSAFIGGVWNLLLGFGGILSFRILSVITIIFTIYFTYLSVKKHIKPIIIPIATLFILLLNNFGIVVFHHNYLTSLLVAISVFFILKGLNQNNYQALFWGTLFCGISIFARIPNITMLALGILIFADYYYEKDTKRLGKNILYGTLGFVSGIGIILLIMFLCGHLDIFKQSIIDNIFSAGTDEQSTHNISYMAKLFITSYKNIYFCLAVFVFSTILHACLYDLSKKREIKFLFIASYAGIILWLIIYAFNTEKYYALILFPLFASCYVDIKNKSIILLNIASLIILFFLPLGSDLGILNMGASCIWLGTFVSVLHAYRYIKYRIQQKKNYTYLVLLSVLCFIYFSYNIYRVSRGAYFDSGNRFEKCYKANNSKFTVYTSENKVNAIDKLLSALSSFVNKGDYLLCFESLPMIHYLSETKPYLGNSWPWTYDPSNFKTHLDKSVESIPLPVVLKQKCQPIGGNWTEPDTYTNRKDSYLYKKKRNDYFEQFITDHAYQIAWEDELFIIYTIQSHNTKW
jgi:hypothetical protein